MWKGALSVLGEEYMEVVNRAFDERWIDFVQNKGKSTGAFCSSPPMVVILIYLYLGRKE